MFYILKKKIINYYTSVLLKKLYISIYLQTITRLNVYIVFY